MSFPRDILVPFGLTCSVARTGRLSPGFVGACGVPYFEAFGGLYPGLAPGSSAMALTLGMPSVSSEPRPSGSDLGRAFFGAEGYVRPSGLDARRFPSTSELDDLSLPSVVAEDIESKGLRFEVPELGAGLFVSQFFVL